MMAERVSDFAERLVNEALRKGFEEAAALVGRSKSVMVKMFNSEISVVQRWSSLVVSLYLAKEGRVLMTTIHPSGVEEAGVLIERAIKVAPQLRPSMLYAPLPEPARVEPLEGLVDRAVVSAMSDPAPLAEAMLAEVNSLGVERAAGALTLSLSEKGLATSKGVRLDEEATGVEAYLRAFIGEASGQWSVGSRKLRAEDLKRVARFAAELASQAKEEAKQVEPGAYDVVLSPMVVGNLMNLVGMMASALAVMMGMSMFARAEPGSKVAAEKFTLVDDPRTPELLGSTAFDDEGLPTASKPIIEGGLLRTLLHNSKTAAKMGAKSTGNAGWLFPHTWTLTVKPGDATLDEMIQEVKRGVVITNNWYTRLQNYVEGIFSTIARDAAFYVENGEVKHPVTRIRIADRLPKLLSNIELLSKELYDISWWEVSPAVRAPYILARQINISRPFE